MSKPILIGFFLTFAFGPGIQHLYRVALYGNYDSAKRSSASDPALEPAWIRMAGLIALQEPDPPSENLASDPDSVDAGGNNRMGFWLLIVPVLLAFSIYLLFEIRKRQAMARQLAMVRAELSALFNNASCGFHSLDERGVFLNVNTTLLGWLGYEKEELVGKQSFSNIIEGGEETALQKMSALKDNDSSRTSLKLVKKSGEKMPVILSVVKMQGFQTNGKQLYSTIDNSECYQALELIKNLDQELEAFSYSISHDLRAPLRSIDGYSRILQEDYAAKLDEEGKRVLNVIMSNAKRMGKLIDDLLEFGRLGRKNMQIAHIDMTGVVTRIVAELRSQEPDRKVDVRVGDLHRAFADADMIRQLWFNLLDNAFKYSGKKEVSLIDVRSFKTDENGICYEVRDNGVGFDMKYAPKLFGVFQRLHKIQDFTGTGVGLAMVKRIVTRHGGRVWAEGSLTEGARFYFTLPNENENT